VRGLEPTASVRGGGVAKVRACAFIAANKRTMQEVLSVRVDTSSDDDGDDLVDERQLKRFDDDDTSSDEAGPADDKAGSSSSDDERTEHAADTRK
jgi:hypothetical protein